MFIFYIISTSISTSHNISAVHRRHKCCDLTRGQVRIANLLRRKRIQNQKGKANGEWRKEEGGMRNEGRREGRRGGVYLGLLSLVPVTTLHIGTQCGLIETSKVE